MTARRDAARLDPPDWAGFADRHAARRAAARRFHPDTGGSPAQLLAAFAAIDAHFAPAPDPRGAILVIRHGAVRRLRVRWRRWYRRRRTSHYFPIEFSLDKPLGRDLL